VSPEPLVERLIGRRLSLVMLCLAALFGAASAHAVITVVTGYTGTRTLTMRIGTPTAGVIDTVTFNVGGTPAGNSLATAPSVNGNGVAITAAGGGVVIQTFFQTPAATSPDTLNVSVTAPVALTCISGGCGATTIPFSSISWTIAATSALDFRVGTFVNGGAFAIEGPGTLNGAGTVDITNTLNFVYANTTAFPAGTYSGTVIYTASLL
jgi:hypothetical protein